MTYTVFYIIFVMVLFLPKTFIFIDVLSHMTKIKKKKKSIAANYIALTLSTSI